jgi:predicted DNA-binding protein YlxM (UPF0122 family)
MCFSTRYFTKQLISGNIKREHRALLPFQEKLSHYRKQITDQHSKVPFSDHVLASDLYQRA